jgi:hypothetical protein
MAIKLDELTPKLAIEMLKIGVVFEREALGLTDVAPKLLDDGNDTLLLREAVQEAQDILARHAPSLGPQSLPQHEKAANSSTIAALTAGDETLPHCNQLQ